MHELLDFLFGFHADSKTVTALQMTTRAIILFFAALGLLRLSGPRTFGGSTAFDLVVKIMLGSVLSRAVAASSPFGGTLLACTAFVLLHRGLAWASYRYHWVDTVVKGSVFLLAEKGQVKAEQLRQLNLNEVDLHEGLRESGNLDSLAETEAVYLERDGSISVVKKKP
ncbi:MAG: DUF421 domain-containing protein [Hymenobacter sp.]|nr:MAG: DUF421 domain-containing protein [Hymenobacter sp.]